MNKITKLVIAVLSLLGSIATPSWSCKTLKYSIAFANADTVLIGYPVSGQHLDEDPDGPIKWKFRVMEVLKGESSDYVDITEREPGCYGFRAFGWGIHIAFLTKGVEGYMTGHPIHNRDLPKNANERSKIVELLLNDEYK